MDAVVELLPLMLLILREVRSPITAVGQCMLPRS